MITLTDFTENDWMAFSGATRFKDGTEPQIDDGEFYTIIADRGGVEIDLILDSHEETVSMEISNKKVTLQVATQIANELYGKTPIEVLQHLREEYGFEIPKFKCEMKPKVVQLRLDVSTMDYGDVEYLKKSIEKLVIGTKELELLGFELETLM